MSVVHQRFIHFQAKKQFVKEPEKEQSTEEQILATAEVAQKKAEAWSDQTTRQLNYSTGQLTRGASQSMEAVKNNLSWKKTRFIRSVCSSSCLILNTSSAKR